MTFYPDGHFDEPARRPATPRLPAPGWLPDPSETHLERYWDGARWTGRTRDRVSKVETGTIASAAYTPRAWTPTPVKRRNPGKIILACLAIAIVAVNAYQWAGTRGYVPAWALIGETGAPVFDLATAAQIAMVDTPVSGYPTFGSTELVRHIEESLLVQEDRIDVTPWAREVGQEGVFDAYTEAYVQNPYAFGGGGFYQERGGKVFLEPQYVYSDEEAERRRAVTYAAARVGLAASGASQAVSDRDKVTAIHDYIVGLADYDYATYEAMNDGATEGPMVERSQEAYGIFADGTAVCNGYAQAFLAMADAAGLDAIQVTGNVADGMTVGGHAWNKVLIDGQWLVVDTTWDDPGGPLLEHDYLLLDASHPLLSNRTEDTDWMVDAQIGAFA